MNFTKIEIFPEISLKAFFREENDLDNALKDLKYDFTPTILDKKPVAPFAEHLSDYKFDFPSTHLNMDHNFFSHLKKHDHLFGNDASDVFELHLNTEKEAKKTKEIIEGGIKKQIVPDNYPKEMDMWVADQYRIKGKTMEDEILRHQHGNYFDKENGDEFRQKFMQEAEKLYSVEEDYPEAKDGLGEGFSESKEAATDGDVLSNLFDGGEGAVRTPVKAIGAAVETPKTATPKTATPKKKTPLKAKDVVGEEAGGAVETPTPSGKIPVKPVRVNPTMYRSTENPENRKSVIWNRLVKQFGQPTTQEEKEEYMGIVEEHYNDLRGIYKKQRGSKLTSTLPGTPYKELTSNSGKRAVFNEETEKLLDQAGEEEEMNRIADEFKNKKQEERQRKLAKELYQVDEQGDYVYVVDENGKKLHMVLKDDAIENSRELLKEAFPRGKDLEKIQKNAESKRRTKYYKTFVEPVEQAVKGAQELMDKETDPNNKALLQANLTAKKRELFSIKAAHDFGGLEKAVDEYKTLKDYLNTTDEKSMMSEEMKALYIRLSSIIDMNPTLRKGGKLKISTAKERLGDFDNIFNKFSHAIRNPLSSSSSSSSFRANIRTMEDIRAQESGAGGGAAQEPKQFTKPKQPSK